MLTNVFVFSLLHLPAGLLLATECIFARRYHTGRTQGRVQLRSAHNATTHSDSAIVINRLHNIINSFT